MRVGRSVVRLALAAAALAQAGSGQAASGYVNNAEQWARLSPAEKGAYAQGLNDTTNFIYTNDDLQAGIVKAARTRCLIQTKMAPNLLADMITTGYDKTPQLRQQPPMIVYIMRLAEICRPIINEDRARFNLPPQ